MAEALYELRDLTVDYGPARVLDIAELALPPAGVTAVVGPNGAGKTTLLRVLAFLLRPSSGVLAFAGERVTARERDLHALRRRVTLVAQSPFLFNRSVRDNLAYGLRARGCRDARRIDAALEAVDLAGAAGRPARTLSGGEAQRAALARALAIDPPVYLLDEPTTHVDREHVSLIEALIARLGESGKAVVLTTHDLDQAYRLGDSVLSLLAGQVSPAPLANVL